MTTTPIIRTLLAALLVSTTALAGIHTERVHLLRAPTAPPSRAASRAT